LLKRQQSLSGEKSCLKGTSFKVILPVRTSEISCQIEDPFSNKLVKVSSSEKFGPKTLQAFGETIMT
jgi:hypothetical protein